MKNQRRAENPAATLEKDDAVQIKRGQSRPYILQTSYSWCIYRDKANLGESVGHMRIYQHSRDPYSRPPAIYLALSSPDPVCFPSVWPIVTESNCSQKTTSNDYFICTSERQGAAASEKSQTGTFNKRTRPPFLFPTHNFRQQRILLTWLRLEHQNKWQSVARGQSAQRRERITGTTWCQPLAPSFLLLLIKSMLQVEVTIEDKQQRHNAEAPFNVNYFILKSPLMSKREKERRKNFKLQHCLGVGRKEKKNTIVWFPSTDKPVHGGGRQCFFGCFLFIFFVHDVGWLHLLHYVRTTIGPPLPRTRCWCHRQHNQARPNTQHGQDRWEVQTP